MTTKAVLTTSSTIACGHPLPGAQIGGPVTLTPAQDVLTIDGKIVLIDSLMGASIGVGCGQVNKNANEVECSTVLAQTGQTSTVLKVNGTPVLLHQTSGPSNGVPKNDWSSTDPKQDVLKAD